MIKIPLELILVEHSTYHRRSLKKRLIQEGLILERCNECGLEPVWNNKSLTLQLDHINGVKDDNRLNNLQLLCPNCHSQTQTFGGRNAFKNRTIVK